ncbi:MAG: sulfotransferase domain-containing protein [Rhodospirillales bacterium]|nr:sulfotransferase domain-containing protein [Rhodospirillales bacterium]
MSKEFYFHIGYQKTGSSTLQQTVFPFINGIYFCGQPYNDKARKWKDFVNLISKMDSLFYEQDKVEKLFLKLCEGIRESKLLLSNENIIAPHESSDMGVVVERIASLSTKPKIVLTIRNQIDIVPSLYMEAFGDIANRAHYISWLEKNITEYNRCYITKHHYYRLAKLLEKSFGRENICLLLLEELRDDPNYFFKTLSEFMGVTIDYDKKGGRVNTRRRGRSFFLTGARERLSYIKRLIPRQFHQPMKKIYGNAPNKILNFIQRIMRFFSPSVDLTLPPDIKQELCDLFREDNRKLKDSFKLDLDRFGYPL